MAAFCTSDGTRIAYTDDGAGRMPRSSPTRSSTRGSA